jgi:hypothetical protein
MQYCVAQYIYWPSEDLNFQPGIGMVSSLQETENRNENNRKTIFIVISEEHVKRIKNKALCPLEGADISAVRMYAAVVSDKGLCTTCHI